MATLKDVARIANVDASTVSRALNNAPNVHPATRERVLAAARQLGYRPNVLAKSLRKGRSRTIGVVVPRIQLTLFAEVIEGVEREARRLGYATIICGTSDDGDIERQELERLRDCLVDGIVIAATSRNGRLLQDIFAQGVAVTQVVRLQEYGLDSVVADYDACGYEAVRYLAKKGCRSIGLINGPVDFWPYRGRLQGYRRALKELGLPEITAVAGEDCNSFEYGESAAARLLGDCSELDAIMTAVDVQGMGAMRALQERGLSCPGDVRLMSLTGHSIGALLETPMTSMEVPAIEIGEKAVRMSIERIETSAGAKAARQHLVFSPTLVERQTT